MSIYTIRLFKATLLLCLLFPIYVNTLANEIRHNSKRKTITLTAQNGDLKLVIDYAGRCVIRELSIKNTNKLGKEYVYTGVTTGNTTVSSLQLNSIPTIRITGQQLEISNIQFGNAQLQIAETWLFDVSEAGIRWSLNRTSSDTVQAEEMAFPKWNFRDLQTWKGGILGNGGVVWCKYLGKPGDSYGVHTGAVSFWEEKSGRGLSIKPQTDPANSEMATRFSHAGSGAFSTTHFVTKEPLQQRHNLNRFVAGKETVFAPFTMEKKLSVSYEISSIDYFKTYDRGNLPGINSTAVRELLNTTARYGVVDNNIVGGNGWLTNWKCLHEPFFAQIATALNDSNYTRNLQTTLDQERDLAMLPDGRVLSRWHNEPGDEIPGTYNAQTGYYEAMWGYTIDSQTGYLINVSELFDLTADIDWLRSHKESCERALDWLIRRDENGNGLYEMMNRNIREEKCSDWLDIVWAGYENAFVNAQMYAALKKWSACELLLKDTAKALHYGQLAAILKTSFNRPVEQGGFWLEAKKQYIYWRDDDNSIHGDNLVTPVNFAAIGYGICDDSSRIKAILEQMETRNVQENLMHWPLCYESFKREEVSERNWPFPTYENGDIFPTWGYLGIRSYVKYDKTLALKYIHKLLDQYTKDGLSSQRYDRKTGLGVGSDILSGICTGITALYTDIYGIQPKWNRLVIAPNMIESLNGTAFIYQLRDTAYQLTLSENKYRVSTNWYAVESDNAFGITGTEGMARFFPGAETNNELVIQWKDKTPAGFSVRYKDGLITVTAERPGIYQFELTNLTPGMLYTKNIDDHSTTLEVTPDGKLLFQESMSTLNKLTITNKR